MEAVRIVILCVIGAMLAGIMRAHRPEMAMPVVLVTGLCALAMAYAGLSDGVGALSELIASFEIGGAAVGLILRATGIALIAELGAQTCRDAGEGALAGKIELGARAVLLGMAAPQLASVATTALSLVP